MTRARLTVIVAAVLALSAIPASALVQPGDSGPLEYDRVGDLLGGFGGDLSPHQLPRTGAAPIAINVAGVFSNVDGDRERLPQLRTISVAINRAGRLFDRGLSTCNVHQIQPASQRAARRICRGALIGDGRVTVQARISGQPSFLVDAPLLVFNGPTRHGNKLILAQAYSAEPPGSFVLTFRLGKRTSGPYGTVLTTRLPRSAWDWAYLERFEIDLHRVYEYKGRRRSFISAACAAPAGFFSALFPFAEATYGFADGRELQIPIVRSCQVDKN